MNLKLLSEALKKKGKYIDGDESDLGSSGIPIDGRDGAWYFYWENGEDRTRQYWENGRQI